MEWRLPFRSGGCQSRWGFVKVQCPFDPSFVRKTGWKPSWLNGSATAETATDACVSAAPTGAATNFIGAAHDNRVQATTRFIDIYLPHDGMTAAEKELAVAVALANCDRTGISLTSVKLLGLHKGVADSFGRAIGGLFV